ncbi:MAG: ankyrin repeat domain-containing protein [Candidatus Omnitrophota bacterium]
MQEPTESKILSLRQAVVNGNVAQVQTLILQGVDIDDTEGSNYGSPLNAAARNGHMEIVKLLLDAGANIDFRNDDIGATPLMMAVDSGQLEAAALLIERGADLNITNVDGANALMYAQGTRVDVRDKIIRLLQKGRS